MVLKMKLTKPANKNGGDRYEAKLPDGSDLVIYFPQVISRTLGAPIKELTITIS